MAPTVADLQTHIERLEARIAALEAGHESSSADSEEAMRMILIGPPGAGTYYMRKE